MKTILFPEEYLYDLKLPYNNEVKENIKRMRKEGYKIRVRGSGERAKWSLIETNGKSARYYDSHLPLKYASHVRLYINK
jgi:hypothetical protein